LASCLPMLIQFPVIIGLYQSIIRALATNPLGLLQLARSLYPSLNSALLIPLNSKFLWMDLGRPEGIPFPGGFTLSFLPYGFPTLAIIVAVTTYLQTKLTMPPPSTNNPNDQAAAMALRTYNPIYWIAGGKAKEGGYSDCEKYIGHIRHTFLIGDAQEKMAVWLTTKHVPFTLSGTLDKALAAAHDMAQQEKLDNAVILLSPACASFDQFRNFEHRGDIFTELVRKMTA
ncbi:MAG: YidC/Oxa1 family membrane protein insertase, partial [Proteobacteria bacterium]|nr:YidC/Oxa1 family membrane protein insertase [Pseudomonadota bacterium]